MDPSKSSINGKLQEKNVYVETKRLTSLRSAFDSSDDSLGLGLEAPARGLGVKEG